MEQINNYYRYTQLMRNGFYDKLFFIDKLFRKWGSMVDYGCADGFLTKLIADIFPEKQLIGYDRDERMINYARFTGSMPNNVQFTSNRKLIREAHGIYLSSVIHEVYSYSHAHVNEFWDDVFSPERKFVVIRDMILPKFEPLTNFDEMVNAILTYVSKINAVGELKRFGEHFNWNGMESSIQAIHFLLKMPYIYSPNWNRELFENYIPISDYDFQVGVIPIGWEIFYEEHYTLPYLKFWWKENLGIDVPYDTHSKYIIQRL